ncbi:MAG: cation:proton antiporter [Pyrodictiaceae archaeon]
MGQQLALWTRIGFIVSGLFLAALVLTSSLYMPSVITESYKSLYTLSSIAALILSSYLIGEALYIAPAVLEILLGFLGSLAGIEPVEVVDVLALVGSVVLMFSAGSEIDISLLRRYLVRSLIVGLISFLVPMTTTSIVLLALGYRFIEAILTGIGVSTTSVAVVYAIVKRSSMLNEKGQLVLASAMVVDLLSIIALVSVVLEASSLVALYAASMLIIPPVFAKLFNYIPESMHEAEIRLIMALLLAITLFSEAVGIHAVLFAFILGMAFSGIIKERRGLSEKVSGLVFGFLSPIFFVTAGLRVKVSGITEALLLSLIVLLASYPAKIVATHYSLRKLLGMSDKRQSIVFGARLTVSTIIAYMGYVRGLLPGELAASIMLSAIVATLISGILAGWKTVEESVEAEEEAILPME